MKREFYCAIVEPEHQRQKVTKDNVATVVVKQHRHFHTFCKSEIKAQAWIMDMITRYAKQYATDRQPGRVEQVNKCLWVAEAGGRYFEACYGYIMVP